MNIAKTPKLLMPTAGVERLPGQDVGTIGKPQQFWHVAQHRRRISPATGTGTGDVELVPQLTEDFRPRPWRLKRWTVVCQLAGTTSTELILQLHKDKTTLQAPIPIAYMAIPADVHRVEMDLHNLGVNSGDLTSIYATTIGSGAGVFWDWLEMERLPDDRPTAGGGATAVGHWPWYSTDTDVTITGDGGSFTVWYNATDDSHPEAFHDVDYDCSSVPSTKVPIALVTTEYCDEDHMRSMVIYTPYSLIFGDDHSAGTSYYTDQYTFSSYTPPPATDWEYIYDYILSCRGGTCTLTWSAGLYPGSGIPPNPYPSTWEMTYGSTAIMWGDAP